MAGIKEANRSQNILAMAAVANNEVASASLIKENGPNIPYVCTCKTDGCECTCGKFPIAPIADKRKGPAEAKTLVTNPTKLATPKNKQKRLTKAAKLRAKQKIKLQTMKTINKFVAQALRLISKGTGVTMFQILNHVMSKQTSGLTNFEVLLIIKDALRSGVTFGYLKKNGIRYSFGSAAPAQAQQVKGQAFLAKPALVKHVLAKQALAKHALAKHVLAKQALAKQALVKQTLAKPAMAKSVVAKQEPKMKQVRGKTNLRQFRPRTIRHFEVSTIEAKPSTSGGGCCQSPIVKVRRLPAATARRSERSHSRVQPTPSAKCPTEPSFSGTVTK